jgi:hypothetical protein
VAEPHARNALRDALVAWLVIEVLVAVVIRLPWSAPLIGRIGPARAGLAVL